MSHRVHRLRARARPTTGAPAPRTPGAIPVRLAAVALAAVVVLCISLSGGVASAAAATNPCTTAPTANRTVPANPFGANVTIFNPSMSVSSINAALNAAPPAGAGKRQFFFMPGTYGDPTITPATATTSNVI
jgi:pectin methylesterase-like acyl-CoA thioesterase